MYKWDVIGIKFVLTTKNKTFITKPNYQQLRGAKIILKKNSSS